MITKEKLLAIQIASNKARKNYFISEEELHKMMQPFDEQANNVSYTWSDLGLNWCHVYEDNKGIYGDFWYYTVNDIDEGKEIKVTEMLRNWTLYRAALSSYLQDHLNESCDSHNLSREEVRIWKK